jgi:hypothetical protein
MVIFVKQIPRVKMGRERERERRRRNIANIVANQKRKSSFGLLVVVIVVSLLHFWEVESREEKNWMFLSLNVQWLAGVNLLGHLFSFPNVCTFFNLCCFFFFFFLKNNNNFKERERIGRRVRAPLWSVRLFYEKKIVKNQNKERWDGSDSFQFIIIIIAL